MMQILTYLKSFIICGIAVALLSYTHAPAKVKQTAVVPVISISIPGSAEEEKIAQVETYLKSLKDREGFNGSILLAHKGSIIYKDAMGFADFDKKDTLALNTRFQLASVSKQFTAVSIMMLEEKRVIDYSCVVEDFFPEFPYKNITIRQLLTHRSGLPNYAYFSDIYWKDRTVPITNKDVIKLMVKHKPRAYSPPGKKFDYSNTNYCILAAIVEKSTGMPFETYVKTQIFEPLGMDHSVIFNLATGNIPANAASGYDSILTEFPENYYLNGVVGDKGIYSTVEDLYKWDQALYSEKLVKQSTLDLAYLPASPELKDVNYGYGWRIIKNDDRDRIVYHAGWWRGFRAYFLRDVKNETTVILLSNIVISDFDRVKDQIADILTKDENEGIVAASPL